MTNKLPSFLGSGGWTRRGLHYLDLDMPDAPLNLSDREYRADTDTDDDDEVDNDYYDDDDDDADGDYDDDDDA